MKKYYIKDLSKNQVIHVPSFGEAEKLGKKFHELGFRWVNGDPYLEDNKWGNYKEETCYCPATGKYNTKDEYKKRQGCEIISIAQLKDFEENSPMKKGKETSIKIEVGKFYVTRLGLKAKIYCTDTGDKYGNNIHGAILREEDSWETATWDKDGAYSKGGIKISGNDIFGEWREEEEEVMFDVNLLPTFNYLAMDRDGSWYIFTDEPTRGIGSVWKAKKGYILQLKRGGYLKDFSGRWEDSLHEIVNGKLIKIG